MAKMTQCGWIVVEPAGRETAYCNPLTGQSCEEERPLYRIVKVDGDAGDPYLEYSGFRLQYVRNITHLNDLEIQFLREQGVVIKGAPETEDVPSGTTA